MHPKRGQSEQAMHTTETVYLQNRHRAHMMLESYKVAIGHSDPTLPEAIARSLKFISEHIFDPRMNVSWMLEQCRFPTAGFSGVFQHHVGMYPKIYILNHRLAAGRIILLEPELQDLPVHSVSLMLGFGSQGAFGHAFRKVHGISPTKWRENQISTQNSFQKLLTNVPT